MSCGDSKDMQELCNAGLMKHVGKVSWVPEPYFTITRKGISLLGGKERTFTDEERSDTVEL